MTVSQNEAAQALDDIAEARAQSRKFLGYQRSSAFFFLWGVLWALANGLCDFFPKWTGSAWIVTDIVGIAVSTYISMQGVQGGRGKDGNIRGLRYLAGSAVYIAFAIAVLSILPPTSGRQVYTFFVLLISSLYMGIGIWTGLRVFIAGAVLFILTVAGYFLLASHFFLWTGMIGGGTLIATGLWLRRV